MRKAACEALADEAGAADGPPDGPPDVGVEALLLEPEPQPAATRATLARRTGRTRVRTGIDMTLMVVLDYFRSISRRSIAAIVYVSAPYETTSRPICCPRDPAMTQHN